MKISTSGTEAAAREQTRRKKPDSPDVKRLCAEITKLCSELKESKSRFRFIADNAHDWEFWLSTEGRFCTCHPPARGNRPHAGNLPAQGHALFLRAWASV